MTCRLPHHALVAGCLVALSSCGARSELGRQRGLGFEPRDSGAAPGERGGGAADSGRQPKRTNTQEGEAVEAVDESGRTSDLAGEAVDPADESGGTERCSGDTWSGGDLEQACRPRTQCLPGEYETDAGSATSDRTCELATICAEGQEQLSAATATRDAVCRDCVAGEFCAGAGFAAITCKPGEACVDGRSYVDCYAVGGFTMDPTQACVPWTVCLPGDVEISPPTGTVDRICAPPPWIDQFATGEPDFGKGVATDGAGHLYVVGMTYGDLKDGQNPDDADGFVRKYTDRGQVEWTRQFGSDAYDTATGVAVDASGGIYVTGFTEGLLHGGESDDDADCFLRKYEADGSVLWTQQFGTEATCQASAVATDGTDDVYVAGSGSGVLEGGTGGGAVFLRKFGAGGSLEWSEQFGDPMHEGGGALAVTSSGNVFLAGYIRSSRDDWNRSNSDAYLHKYDSEGEQEWTIQFGTPSDDYAYGLATDEAGNVYCVGRTDGNLAGVGEFSSINAFVKKYSDEGFELWTDQFAFGDHSEANAVVVDVDGNVFVGGYSSLVAQGDGEVGGLGAFVRRYSAEGVTDWTREFVTDAFGGVASLASDGTGGVFAVGTSGVDVDTGEALDTPYSVFLMHVSGYPATN